MPGVDSAPDADAVKASERRRKVRRWKVALTLAGLAVVALLVWRCLTTPFLAIDSVEVRGPVETLGLQEVVGAVRTSLKGNMLTADIEAVKHAVEEISWVKSAAVMRVWPIRRPDMRPLSTVATNSLSLRHATLSGSPVST